MNNNDKSTDEKEEPKSKKLKPIIFVEGNVNGPSYTRYHQHQTFKELQLLKALTITVDPQKLRKLAGLRTVADVYRTLDKLQFRKEFHEALARHNISFDYIVGEIKSLIEGSDKDAVRLGALQTLLKSLGIDKYEEESVSNRSWEDLLIAASGGTESLPLPAEYEVIEPETPEKEIDRISEEHQIGRSIYGEA